MSEDKTSSCSCLRCGHHWFPRKPNKDPRVCAKCRSPYWNIQKKRKNIAHIENSEKELSSCSEAFLLSIDSNEYSVCAPKGVPLRVFDFFSGGGGASCGFRNAGLKIALGVDQDEDCSKTFQANIPEARFVQKNIASLSPKDLEPFVSEGKGGRLFCGCAPCQPFSKQNKNKNGYDDRLNLLENFGVFVEYFKPEYVFIENVPGLQNIQSAQAGPLGKFQSLLDELGYQSECNVIYSCDYGVPQRRARLVLIASTLGPVRFPKSHYGPNRKFPYSKVADWISGLPPLEAGEADPVDSDHCSSPLSAMNLSRIRATPTGGSHRDWPFELKLDCHMKHDGHTDAYGRLAWDKMAGALTTKCISLSNGRFGHPDQDRALSVREAALLQTFPENWKFSGSLWTKARQVGNAVPPLLAFAFGKTIKAHYRMYGKNFLSKQYD